MFTKKPHIDIKKSIQKVLDIKKDSYSRLKHLKQCLEFSEFDARTFFEHNYSHIYYVFFDTLSNLDVTIKQKGQKQAREEQECCLHIFEKILIFLPDLLNKGWQQHSISFVLQRLLHHDNSIQNRQEGIRLFLIWFQILNDTTRFNVNHMFSTLVPGLVPDLPNPFLSATPMTSAPPAFMSQSGNVSHLNRQSSFGDTPDSVLTATSLSFPNSPMSSVFPTEIEPLPSYTMDLQPRDATCFYLQFLLEVMVSQVDKILWKENCLQKQMNSFRFLFDCFKQTYLPHIFPKLDTSFSYYAPKMETPKLSMIFAEEPVQTKRFQHANTLLQCKTILIKWLTRYLRSEELRKEPFRMNSQSLNTTPLSPLEEMSQEPSAFQFELVFSTLTSTRENVNLLHQLLGQVFRMPFTQALTMRKVVMVYRDWIYKAYAKTPAFLHEPDASKPDDVSGGFSPFHQTFIIFSSNVFMQKISQENQLDEQVEMCKRVLNIYRYMVMKVDMDRQTWEQLLMVILQITSIVLSENLPERKELTLGGRLAPAFFETLIVTWIRANLNIHVSLELWTQFKDILGKLTAWEELIREWARTMDTLTRVMSRYVYNINLYDLPLERPVDRKQKRTSQLPPTKIGESTVQKVAVAKEETQQESEKSYTRKKSPPKNLKLQYSISSTVSRSLSDSELSGRRSRSRSRNSTFNKSLQKNESKDSGRAKSLDQLESETVEDSDGISYNQSRSPSPTSCSNHFGNIASSKDLQIDVNNSISGQQSNVSSQSNGKYRSEACRSVIAGGNYRNWSVDSAIILWRRMLGILGDVNKIKNPNLHFLIMECLAKIVEDFIKIRENLGVTGDATGKSNLYPTLIPPMEFFVPWLFQSTQLSDEFKSGKLIAFKLLCAIAIRRHEIPMENHFLPMFYLTIHKGLITYDIDLISVIIKYCGAKLFSFNLPGASCLLYDFAASSKFIIHSNEIKKGIPRFEALSLCGTLLGMSGIYNEISALNPHEIDPTLVHYKDHEDCVLNTVIYALKKEKTSLGRAVAINSIGLHLYQNLAANIGEEKIKELFNLLIDATKFSNRTLSRIASDALRLQTDHVAILIQKYNEIIEKVIKGLVQTIQHQMQLQEPKNNSKDFQNLILNLLMCLSEWCMAIPITYLKRAPSNCNLISIVFKLLHSLKDGQSTLNSNKIDKIESEIDYTISLDNLSDNQLIAQKRKAESRTRGIFEEPDDKGDQKLISLTAQMLVNHLGNLIGHFPFDKLGASRICCNVNEFDDNPLLIRQIDNNDLSMDLFSSPNVLCLVANSNSIISFVDISKSDSTQTAFNETAKVRIIIRDLIGRFAWTCSPMLSGAIAEEAEQRDRKSLMSGPSVNSFGNEDDDVLFSSEQPPDPLDALMHHLGEVSPECLRKPLGLSPGSSLEQNEENMIALLLNQHFQEMNYAEKLSESGEHLQMLRRHSDLYELKKQRSSEPLGGNFAQCRKMIDQLGWLFWEKRAKLELLAKNERVLRELRNLDKQKSRETHKIAVIYVKEGQEHKNSILLNKCGSKEFEQFVAGLGWEVDLARHNGFRGGLEENLSTGKSAPYFANAFYEVIFHVSTRIPVKQADSNNEKDESETESLNRKLRHLGNDEIHIVWSEHFRNYRRGIIPTEFCDVLIVIYPIISLPGFYRVTIFRKNEIPFFGPLFNGAVVHISILASLVRATAVNASRAQRSQVAFYQHYFQERGMCLEKICKSHLDLRPFEQFAASVHSPQQQLSSFDTNTSQSPSNQSTSNRPLSRQLPVNSAMRSGEITRHLPISSQSSAPKNVASSRAPLMSKFRGLQQQSSFGGSGAIQRTSGTE